MVTGRPPFAGDSPVMVASKHVLEQATPPSKLNADVSAGLEAVIMKALSKNPDNRYQDAEELHADLERARLGRPVQATPLLPETAQTAVIAPGGPPTVPLPPVGPEGGRRWWIPALIVLGIVALLGGGLYLLASSLLKDNATQVKVPSVLGFSQAQATSTLENEGFKVTPVLQTTDKPGEVGNVIAQAPVAETVVDSGSTVTITVGKAPKQVKVPDLIGKTQNDAEAAITHAHLKVGNVTPQTSSSPVGQVIAQSPFAGQMVSQGSPVDIVVSSGPGTVTVPDLTCMSYGQARSALASNNLLIQDAGQMPASLACSKQGKVVSQDPTAGSTADAGSTVQVWLVGEPSPSPTPSPSF
jgi:beta-lactam-binding protein with PASTA domain